MAPNVIPASRDDLEARRRVVLDRVGTTLDDLRSRRDAYSLTGEEEALTELEEIEFLLGA